MMRWSARLALSPGVFGRARTCLGTTEQGTYLATRRHTWERDEIIVLHVNVGIPRKFLVPVRRLAKKYGTTSRLSFSLLIPELNWHVM
jgi:hypothetical protein